MADVVDPEYRQEPVYICDETSLRTQIQMLKQGFLGWLAYAVKANPNHRILEIISEEGVTDFDIASLGEAETVRRVQPTANLLYNNPVKTPYEIEMAATEFGVRHFTVQTLAEVRKILEYTAAIDPTELEIVVRLKPPPNEAAFIDFHDNFGAERERVLEMIEFLQKETNARLGISVHTGSQNHDMESYKTAIQMMVEIARLVKCLKILNIGGGLPANYFGYPKCDVKKLLGQINRFLRKQIADLGLEEIYMEQGRSVVAESTHLVTPVVEADAEKNKLRIRDGVFGSYSGAKLHSFVPHMQTFRKTVNGLVRLPSSERKEVLVFGRTCDAKDVLPMQVPLGVESGDILCFPAAGAYTSTSASHFNGFEPPRYVYYQSETAPLKFTPETFHSQEITPKLIAEVVDFYRYIFNNSYGGHYLLFPKAGEFLSAQHIFDIPEGQYVDLETMDSLKDFPVHPETKEGAIFWRNPAVMKQNFEQKLAKEGCLTVLRNAEGAIAGITFGYITTLREVFEREDWRNPFLYSGIEIPEQCRDFENYLKRINIFLESRKALSADSQVFCYNCIALDPKARGIKSFFALVKSFFTAAGERHGDKLVVSETELGSTAYRIFHIAGVQPVPGVFTTSDELSNGDTVLTLAQLQELMENFSLPLKEFKKKCSIEKQ